jgi:hypothetical protein
MRRPVEDFVAVRGLAVWTLESPSVVEIGYVLVTQGPRGRAAVPDGRCGLGLVDGVP